MFSALLGCMGQILIMVSLGFFLQKKHMLGGEETRNSLTRLLIDVLTPCLILSSSSRAFSSEAGSSIIRCMILSLLYYGSSMLICFLLYRLLRIDPEKRGVAVTSSVFANTAFIGLPIITSLFGSEGVLYSSSFGIGYSLYMYSIGVRLFSAEKKPFTLKSFISPNLIAVIVSNIIYFSPFRFPPFIASCLSTLGSATVPLSLIIIGSMFVGVSLKDIFADGFAYVVSFMRLLAIPLILLLVLKVTRFLPDNVIRVCVIAAAVPVGSFNVILSRRYGGNTQFANSCLFVSMILSPATLPLISAILQKTC